MKKNKDGTSSYWTGLFIALGVIVACMSIAGIVVGAVAYNYSTASFTQKEYLVDDNLAVNPDQHVLLGATPLTVSLPNDLTLFKGHRISVDCVNAGGHTIRIAAGPLATRWQLPNLRLATCTQPGDGITFRVTSAYTIRIESATAGMIFS